MKPMWRFAPNTMEEVEGPNNPGISTFTNDRAGALVREFLQNSIDARASSDIPVKVVFDIKDIPSNVLDLHSLYKSMVASCDSPDNDGRHRKQFRRGAKMLDKAIKDGFITALVVTDGNTTGARDERGRQDKWHSLTKAVGKSEKDARDAAGSFGIGKHAAFAATDLRTVFYSTAYRNGVGGLHRRFTGKSILVSHESGGKAFRATGYLGDNNSNSLRDEDVPKSFCLDSPGTRITIPGFSRSEWGNSWCKQTEESLVTHFFHALAHKNLVIHLGGQIIDHRNLNELAAKYGDRVKNLAEVSMSPIVESVEIEGVGKVNLRIIVDHEGVNRNKTVALVRDAGMMITDRIGNMRRARTVQMMRIPPGWMGFTAIIECLSEKGHSLLRESEGPKHDSISPDNADESERAAVRKAIRELGEWARNAIEKYAKPPDPDDSDNANEMAKYLPLSADGSVSSTESGRGRFEITQAQQSRRPPRGLITLGRSRRRRPLNVPGQTRKPPGGGTGKKGKGKNKGKNREPVEVVFNELRRLPSMLNQWPAHTAKFAFDAPTSLPKRIRLYVAGEDGNPIQVQIERAYIDGRRIKVRRGEITDLSENDLRQDRVHLEVKAIRPISDKRLEIRSV